MQYFKKGTLVFVHTETYPPWPAQVERKYENGLYKVNFIGEKSYTKIEQDKMDIFTQERAKQIHSQLEDRKLSKAIFVALKQFENRKKKGQLDQDFIQFLKKPLPLLDLSMYKNAAKLDSTHKSSSSAQFTPYSFAKYLPSNSTEDNLQQIGKTLDKIYDFIILPVHQKLPPYLSESDYGQKKIKIEQQIYKLKQLLLKQQQNLKPGYSSSKQNTQGNKGSSNSIDINLGSRKNIVMEDRQNSKQILIDKLVDTKIVEKIIMTIKAYESFREENEEQFEETINFLRQKFNFFYDKFKEEYNRKKLPSHKDRIMIQKFEKFQAYL